MYPTDLEGDHDLRLISPDRHEEPIPKLHLRRSTRKKDPSKRLSGFYVAERGSQKPNAVSDESDEFVVDGDDEEYEDYKKPDALFDEENDVAGQNLFTFRSPRKRYGMATLAATTPKTPKVPKLTSALQALSFNSPQPDTPRGKGRPPKMTDTTKTPHHIRELTQKGKF